MAQPKPDPHTGIDRFTAVTTGAPQDPPGIRSIATRDHDAVRRWAATHSAEPATGEATASGPAVLTVRDTGPGIRFNFPGFARFRPISWDEWFDNFDRYDLVFVYEEEDEAQVAARARELWNARGRGEGRADADWFEAERELRLRRPGGAVSDVRYRLITRDALAGARGPERTTEA
jgi:hypothetical protein